MCMYVCTKCAGVSCKSILVPFRIIILLIRRAQANWIGNFLMMNDLPERSCAVRLMSSFSIDSFNCCSTIYCYCNCMNHLTHCIYSFDDFVIFLSFSCDCLLLHIHNQFNRNDLKRN